MVRLLVRKFEPKDNRVVQHIFYDGLMEMVPDTAFRGLRHHPESLLLYAAMTGKKTSLKMLNSNAQRKQKRPVCLLQKLFCRDCFSCPHEFYLLLFAFFRSFSSCHHKVLVGDRTPPSDCAVFALLLQQACDPWLPAGSHEHRHDGHWEVLHEVVRCVYKIAFAEHLSQTHKLLRPVASRYRKGKELRQLLFADLLCISPKISPSKLWNIEYRRKYNFCLKTLYPSILLCFEF